MADTLVPDRRAWPRITATESVCMSLGRHRPGRHAFIIDVSRGGALIETEHRLSPGMPIELHFGAPVSPSYARGRVLRCHVALLGRERIRYRGALAFDAPVAIDGNRRPVGSSCAEALASDSQ